MEWVTVCEWGGSITGLIGAALLAMRCRASGLGFVFFLVSNACWFVYGIEKAAPGLVLMQIGFTLTSLVGLYRWLWKKNADAPASASAGVAARSRGPRRDAMYSTST